MIWDDEVDVLVIGSGAAGMTAALADAASGLKVAICEKAERIGGTSANTILVTPKGLLGAADPRTRGSLAAGY